MSQFFGFLVIGIGFNVCYLYRKGARGGVVVKAIRYKPAGCGFDSRWFHCNFSVA